MQKNRIYTDEDVVIMLYRLENRIFKHKNKFGKLKPKIEKLNGQGIETAIFAPEMESMINEILKQSGAKKEVLQ